MTYKNISGFSDEIASDIKVQFEALSRLGMKYFEPRGVNGKGISHLSDEEISELKEQMQKYDIKVSSIGSPIGKIKLSDDFEEHFELLKRVIEIAKMLDCRYIRMFSFYNDGGEWTSEERKMVFDRMRRMVELAKQEGMILLHENEKDIYGDIAERCLDLFNEFGCENFRAVFDPANFVQSGEDTKHAYELLKDHVAYMHIKDAIAENGHVVPAGYGDGNVEYIIRSLFERGYDGFLSLEPHLGVFDGLADLELSDEMLALPRSTEGSFVVAYKSLVDILKKIS